MARLILASTSRHRRRLLERLGLPFDTADPAVDESSAPGEPPRALAERLALAKANSLAVPGSIVIGADQVPVLDGRRLRKPADHATALSQLMACQGKPVVFYTSVAVVDARTGEAWQHTDVTTVHFATLAESQIERYLRQEQPYDCAGGFMAEGLGIVLFERIDSSDPTALLGMPLIWVAGTLRRRGLDPLNPPLSV